MNELEAILAQGDADLMATAGEQAAFRPRGAGTDTPCRVVAGPAPVEYVLELPGGATVTCTRVVQVARAALGNHHPAPGDTVTLASGEMLQVARVNSSAHDPSWHLECCVITRRALP